MTAKKVEASLREAGYDTLEEFLLDHPGRSLTEMAEVLGVSVAEFTSYHHAWVMENAPDPLGER